MTDLPELPRALWSGTRPIDWTEEEWQGVVGPNPLAPLRGDRLLALYRQWRWAHYLCAQYGTELLKKRRRREAGVTFGWHGTDEDQVFIDPPWLGIDLEEPEWAAHYAWMSFLQSVIEGLERVKVALPGRLGADLARVRKTLRDQRNAVMHAAEKPFWDNRLIELWYADEEANRSVMALHVGIGGMILNELQRRDAEGLTGPEEVRIPRP